MYVVATLAGIYPEFRSILVQGVLAEPRDSVVRSQSQPITARGSGGAR